MKAEKVLTIAVAVLAMMTGVAAAQSVGAPSGNGVTPVYVEGNPDCGDLGFDFGFKPQPEPPPSGPYSFPDGIHDATISSDGTYFGWTSTLGLDAVIVKGGPNANVYGYSPESTGDTNLHSPVNPNNGTPYAISHIEFCYDYEVDVLKTAVTSYTRTYQWSILKSVDPANWVLFTGDSATSEYTIAVAKTGFTDSGWAVAGTIAIDNHTPFDATISSVTDAVSGIGAVAVDCGVSFPYALASLGSLECSYESPLPDGSNRTNTATVGTDPSGDVGGNQDTVDVTFGDPTTVVNDSVNVADTNGGSWLFAASGSVSYQRTFTCDGDEGAHGNVATIVETGQSDDASVTVQCYDLCVTKDAETSYTRTWNWSILKSTGQDEVLLSLGQVFTASYDVTVDATSNDSDFAAAGTITIQNTHPSETAQLTGVSDVVSPDIGASVVCPSLTVPPGGSLECAYNTDLEDASSRTNTATATLLNVSIAPDGTVTAAGTTDFSGTYPVTFGDPTEVVDECITASDNMIEGEVTICVGELPWTKTYTIDIGPFTEEDCTQEQREFVNVASIMNEEGETQIAQSSVTIAVNLACGYGCTLTPGYWKTHSEYGPAPYDDTWATLSSGADTAFFLSGHTYYEVLWTPPKGGNAYYILAHAYIAAELNQRNGASIPAEVMTAFDAATTLFEIYTPEAIGALKGKPSDVTLRSEFIQYAALLDWYNNGIIGPGHCSE